jgi:DNA polymerase-3 subunit delta'
MFDKLVGNNHIKTVLRRLIAQKRVPNSLLFVGEDGVGKRHFALELVKAFVCQNPKNSEACDVCAACRRADKFAFPKSDKNDDYEKVIFSEHSDVGMVIPYKNSILVKAIRDLEREANFRPYEANARFFLIDNAEKLSVAKDNAANALLKTLEEPAATSHIFLITSRPDALLPTIRSRCQTVRFAPIDSGEIESYLLKTKKCAPDDAALLAKLSNGKLGHALKTDLGKFRERRDQMIKVLESILIKENRAELLRVAEEMNDAKNKDGYEASLETLQTLIHDVWTLKNNANEKILVNVDLISDLRKLAAGVESKRLSAWLSEIENLREGLAINLNRKIATDALFMQMAN